jgi:hypothetical protein
MYKTDGLFVLTHATRTSGVTGPDEHRDGYFVSGVADVVSTW